MSRHKITKADRERWARKHGETADFDPSKRTNVIGEEARKLVLTAFIEAIETVGPQTNEELEALARGVMAGVACALTSMSHQSDGAHAAIRAKMIALSPWAVDFARSIDGLPPLATD